MNIIYHNVKRENPHGAEGFFVLNNIKFPFYIEFGFSKNQISFFVFYQILKSKTQDFMVFFNHFFIVF